MTPHSNIATAIQLYADAYKIFEEHSGDAQKFFASGDHKTGAIAEYYVYWYLRLVEKENDLRWESNHNAGWDFKKANGQRIQVKCVSDWSDNRIIHIKSKAYDYLHIVSLTKDFKVRSFHTVRRSYLHKKHNKTKGRFRWCDRERREGFPCALLKYAKDKSVSMIQTIRELQSSTYESARSSSAEP